MKAVAVLFVAVFALVSSKRPGNHHMNNILDMFNHDGCNRACGFNYQPVCATFVAEFGNECAMNAAACRLLKRGMRLQESSEGSCPGCAVACTADYSPVCGSDGQTYSNQCEMRVQSCQSNQWIEVSALGECEAEATGETTTPTTTPEGDSDETTPAP